MASPSSEEQHPPPISQPSPRREETPKECLHKTKSIQFFNRSTPIILQNDNGPCPLLAICNVLLLRNQLNLSADISEVSQEKLLSLVAERLIDSNSNIDNKDAEYVQNQQQNISDAIDLLPRLTTGIDVNIKFQRIGDFEFTRECAIFDLLDIPLYHGWLVDPQDYATAKAIGSKSYNTITRELVFLQEMDGKGKAKSEEDCVDFAAATAATLGVPSPSLSRTKSCNDSPRSAPEESYVRKGDAEEEAELMRVLQLSEKTPPVEGHDSIASGPCGENSTVISDENIHQMEITPMSPKDKLHEDDANGKFQGEQLLSGGSVLPCSSDDLISFEEPDQCNNLSPNPMVVEPRDQLSFTQFEGSSVGDLTKDGTWAQNQTKSSPFSGIDSLLVHDQDTQLQSSTDCLDKDTPTLSGNEMPASAIMDADLQIQTAPDAGLDTKIHDESGIEDSTVMSGHSDTLSSNIQKSEATESFTSSLNNSEPIYEGEERILDSSATVCEVREPIYEGEVVLAKQGDESNIDVHDSRLKDEITPEEGELIGNFLKNNASQLTFYGLFSLQEGLKERELCVFFRNNHFCTMYKLDGELYLLTTDQGYLTQPGIVWEKLNEVNGDSVFYDTNFQEFRPETQSSGTWDEQNAVASTADYMARIGNPGQDGSSINSDLQLAIALQQQEFDEQQSQRRAPQQPTQGCARVPGSVPDSGRGPGAGGGSRLITGPQTPRTSARPSTSSPKQDKKSKDGCSIM